MIPKGHWEIPSWISKELMAESADMLTEKGVQYSKLESYHQMCRWNSGKFYEHPALKDIRWYWRVEPKVQYITRSAPFPNIEILIVQIVSSAMSTTMCSATWRTTTKPTASSSTSTTRLNQLRHSGHRRSSSSPSTPSTCTPTTPSSGSPTRTTGHCTTRKLTATQPATSGVTLRLPT